MTSARTYSDTAPSTGQMPLSMLAWQDCSTDKVTSRPVSPTAHLRTETGHFKTQRYIVLSRPTGSIALQRIHPGKVGVRGKMQQDALHPGLTAAAQSGIAPLQINNSPRILAGTIERTYWRRT